LDSSSIRGYLNLLKALIRNIKLQVDFKLIGGNLSSTELNFV